MIIYKHIENYQEAEAIFSSRKDMMTAEERLRFSHYRKLEDRVNFLLGRIMVKSILNPSDPISVRLVPDRYGRPVSTEGNQSNFSQFSLSHTEGLVAVLFSTGELAGLDVERMQALDFMPLLETIAHPLEIARFSQDEEKEQAFYSLWTMKEAYLKLKGVGFLDQNLDLKSIDLKEEIIEKGYSFVSQKIHDNYLLSALIGHSTSKTELQIEQWNG